MIQNLLKRLILRFLPERMLQNLKKIHYARALRAAAEYGEPDLKIVRHLVPAGGRAIDIGANFGLYTRFFSELVQPLGRVFAIEPIPMTYDVLTSNLKKLKLNNVEPLNLAVSEKNSQAIMEVPHYRTGGENFYEARIVPVSQPSLRHIAVTTRSLDSLFDNEKNIDFIKCDVEGHELACLRGAQRLLRRCQPAWLIEISGNPDDANSSAGRVVQWLLEYGYHMFWFDGLHLRPRQRGDRSVNYFFLLTRHLRKIPEDLLRDWPVATAQPSGHPPSCASEISAR